MRLYMSGPMSGIQSFNIPAFDELADRLRAIGHEVVSPAELDSPEFRQACLESDGKTIPPGGDTWGSLLARDVRLLADDGIEGIVVLPGWERSRGALLEVFVGRLCTLPIYRYEGWIVPLRRHELESAHAIAAACMHRINYSLRGNTPIAVAPLHECGVTPDTAESVQCDAEAPVISALPPQDRAGHWEARVVDPATGGEKGVKQAVLGDLDPKALMEVAKVAGFGRSKYARLNYARGYPWSLSYDACQRHLHQFWSREELDDETGLHHLAAAAWHCLAMLCFVLRKLGTDDRLG